MFAVHMKSGELSLKLCLLDFCTLNYSSIYSDIECLNMEDCTFQSAPY